jgi:hypothetical protein
VIIEHDVKHKNEKEMTDTEFINKYLIGKSILLPDERHSWPLQDLSTIRILKVNDVKWKVFFMSEAHTDRVIMGKIYTRREDNMIIIFIVAPRWNVRIELDINTGEYIAIDEIKSLHC